MVEWLPNTLNCRTGGFMKFRLFMAAMLATLLGVVPFAAPASAATLHGCAEDAICLYANINYGYAKWQSSFYNLSIAPNDCVNLTQPMAYWPNGTKVTDNSGSLVANGTGAYNGASVYIFAYNWANCNGGGGQIGIPVHMPYTVPNLNDERMAPGIRAYHTITSIGIHTN